MGEQSPRPRPCGERGAARGRGGRVGSARGGPCPPEGARGDSAAGAAADSRAPPPRAVVREALGFCCCSPSRLYFCSCPLFPVFLFFGFPPSFVFSLYFFCLFLLLFFFFFLLFSCLASPPFFLFPFVLPRLRPCHVDSRLPIGSRCQIAFLCCWPLSTPRWQLR